MDGWTGIQTEFEFRMQKFLKCVALIMSTSIEAMTGCIQGVDPDFEEHKHLNRMPVTQTNKSKLDFRDTETLEYLAINRVEYA